METKGWDVFRSLPPETDSSSENIQKWLKNAVKILKVVAYLFTFCMVLVCSVVTKGTTLFMTSQLKLDRTVEYCNHELERGKEYVAKIATQERVAWTWCIFFAFIIPELGKMIIITQTRLKDYEYCTASDVCVMLMSLCFQELHSDQQEFVFSNRVGDRPFPTFLSCLSSRRCTLSG